MRKGFGFICGLVVLLTLCFTASAQTLPDQLKAARTAGNRATTSAQTAAYGNTVYVDTVNGKTSNSGYAVSEPLKTMAAAFAAIRDFGTIYVVGDVREELLTPLGVQGVRIIGAGNGMNRHDDGVRWREPASGATSAGALLTIREQGWEVWYILFVPKTDGTAVRLRRAENATYPDGSHAIVRYCKFIGNVAFGASGAGVGIEDHGGSHHNLIADNEFDALASAIKSTSGAGIAAPLRWTIENNVFIDNTAHIVLPANQTVIRNNVFDDPSGSIIDTSGAAGGNFVLNNQFSNDVANVNIAGGYIGGTADVWRNFAQNQAAFVVGLPQ